MMRIITVALIFITHLDVIESHVMKILVPIDFSKFSNNAALFAARLAKKVKGEIILFNVVHLESLPRVQISQSVKHKIEDVRISNAQEDCMRLINELQSSVKGVPISFKITQGYPIENVIQNYAVANKIDLIVMGTKGASGLKKILFGSNAVAVINTSSIPVMTVPIYSRFNKLKRILYATDMHQLHYEIEKLIPIAQSFDASIYILHILPQNSRKKVDITFIKSDLIKKYKYKKILFHVSYNDDILEGINEYVADIRPDLLSMYTHEKMLFDKLFGKSLSDSMAFHSLVPLLTLKK